MNVVVAGIFAMTLVGQRSTSYKKPKYEKLYGHRLNSGFPTQTELVEFDCPLLRKAPGARWVSRMTTDDHGTTLGIALSARTSTHELRITIGESMTLETARLRFTNVSIASIGPLPRGGFFVGAGADESCHTSRNLCKGGAQLKARVGRRVIMMVVDQYITKSDGSERVLFTDAQLRNMDRLMGIMIAKLKKFRRGASYTSSFIGSRCY